MPLLNFRVGTTSYIIPDDILPNVKYLADKVEDIELVLFEVDDGPCNLLTAAQRLELKQIAAMHGLSFTVHLPLDLSLASSEGEQDVSLLKARKVIDGTHELCPWAYVLHLDGKEILGNPGRTAKEKWLDQAVKALAMVSEWVGTPQRLAVENLEGYPLNFWDAIFERIPVSRCMDIGHVWLDGHDPVPYLEKNLKQTRVLHMHGIADRDHQSLDNVPFMELVRVIDCVQQSGFAGVMTLEVFSEDAFLTSICSLKQAMDYLNLEIKWEKN